MWRMWRRKHQSREPGRAYNLEVRYDRAREDYAAIGDVHGCRDFDVGVMQCRRAGANFLSGARNRGIPVRAA
jgi:hypothetical protein